MRHLFLLILLLFASSTAFTEPISLCGVPPQNDDPRKDLAYQCSERDIEDCLTVFSEGGRYYVEHGGIIIAGGGGDHIVEPIVETDPNFDSIIIVGNTGQRITITISSGQNSTVHGPYSVHSIVQTYDARKVIISPDKAHFAFVEVGAGGLMVNVDGAYTNLPSDTRDVKHLQFTPDNLFVKLDSFNEDNEKTEHTLSTSYTTSILLR